MGPEFIQLSGEDMTALAYNGGWRPRLHLGRRERRAAALRRAAGGEPLRRLSPARSKVQDRLVPLHDAIFVEPGLAGAKCGLALLGRGGEEIRLPMLPVTDATKGVIRAAMVHAGLINA